MLLPFRSMIGNPHRAIFRLSLTAYHFCGLYITGTIRTADSKDSWRRLSLEKAKIHCNFKGEFMELTTAMLKSGKIMFRKIRRKEKQLTLEECHEILIKAEYGTLATIGADGYPYAVTVNYVFYNGSIYFQCCRLLQTRTCLRDVWSYHRLFPDLSW